MNKHIFVAVLIPLLAACSNKALYETMQNNERQSCIKEPPATYDECMRRVDMTYEEYEELRNAE